MLKPLLPSIPSKELLIEGKFYRVYKQVYLHTSPKQTVLDMVLARHRKQRHIKTFPKIKDIALKDKAIHLYIEDVLTMYHDHIEQHYVGDRFVKIDSLSKPRIQISRSKSYDYVNIEYTYKRSPESIVKDATTSQTTKQVGRLGVVTQTDIDAKMAEVEEHQRRTLERFKIYVEEKRKTFREQVNKETAERDQQLQLQEIYQCQYTTTSQMASN